MLGIKIVGSAGKTSLPEEADKRYWVIGFSFSREEFSERAAQLKEKAGEKFADAKEKAGEKFADAKTAAEQPTKHDSAAS